MKASDIKPGTVIDGWAVTNAIVYNYHGRCPSGRPGALIEYKDDPLFVLLELELMGDVLHEGEDSTIQAVERARTWYRADEEVEVET